MHLHGDKPLDKKLLPAFLASAGTLGLLQAWYIFAGNVGPQVFGIETPYNLVFRTASQIPLILILFAFGSQRLRLPWSFRGQVIAGTISSVASAGLFLFLDVMKYDEPLLVALSGLLAGIAYTLLLLAWFSKNLTKDFFGLYLRMVCASIIMMLMYITLLFTSTAIIIWCVILLPVAMAIMYLACLSNRLDEDQDLDCPAVQSKNNPTLLGSLGLSMFANGLLIFSWIPASAANWVYALIPLAMVVYLLIVLLIKRLTPYSMFALLSAFICLSIIVVLLLPSSIPLFSSLIFAGFWLLLEFSFATAAWYGAHHGSDRLRVTSKYLGFIVSAAFFSGIVGSLTEMQDVAYLAIAATLLAFSLAIALAKGSLTVAPQEAEPVTPAEPHERWRDIASANELTERECDVFYLLAKGYSLKSISEKLVVSENTVKSHRRRIYLKLGVNSRQELIDLVEANNEALPSS